MSASLDLTARMRHAAWLRRAPVWFAGALPWLYLRSAVGVVGWVAWVAIDAWRLHRAVRQRCTAWLNEDIPALEDSAGLLAHATSPLAQLQRARLLARLDNSVANSLATSVNNRALRAIVKRRIRPGLGWLATSVVAASLMWMWQARVAPAPTLAALAAPAVPAAPPVPELVMRIAPPRYTGIAPSTGPGREVQVPEQSTVTWCLRTPVADAPPVQLGDGRQLKLGAACASLVATESVTWRWRGARFNLRVLADEAPQVSIAAPKEMVQELQPGATSACIAVSVRDDYRVERATLHLTLARGSGESIKFTDREMPLPASSDPTTRNWFKQWTLAELGMAPGDELYFFVRAVDNAPHPHTTQSATYTLRLPGPVETDADDTSVVPTLVKPESLRSQRQIIIDTEQLLSDMKSRKLGADTVRERSESIAGDQGQLRRRYGQFLGEESTLFGGDDHDDHKDGGKSDLMAEFGHVHDQAEAATLFDEATKKVLRRALVAMWDAEKSLRAIVPHAALAPEHKALDAIKELQQADRIYLHKTAFTPPAIKEDIRMSGDMTGAASYQRAPGEAPQAVPAYMRDLLQALDSDKPLPALWTRTAYDWTRERIVNDEHRLAAQRAIQDVADGCAACRPVLRAWLRSGITQAPLLLQAQPVVATPFTRAWQRGAQP